MSFKVWALGSYRLTSSALGMEVNWLYDTVVNTCGDRQANTWAERWNPCFILGLAILPAETGMFCTKNTVTLWRIFWWEFFLIWPRFSGRGLLLTEFTWVRSETMQDDNAVSTGCEDIPTGHQGFSRAIKKRCTLTNEIFPKREAWSRFWYKVEKLLWFDIYL